MPATLTLEIASPDKLLVSEQVSEVQIPALNGYIGVFPDHAPLLSALGTGVLSYVVGGHRRSLAVSGGFVEVLPDHVRVLADRAEKADDIDLERARAAVLRAEKHLATITENTDMVRALNALKRAQARLGATGK
jgi:F-type H+-transporting ATPase subunit epsilon